MLGVLNVGQIDLHLSPGEHYVRELLLKEIENDENRQKQLENKLKETYQVSSAGESINLDAYVIQVLPPDSPWKAL